VRFLEKDYISAMDFKEGEYKGSILNHIFVGLDERGLSKKGHLLMMPKESPDKAYRSFHPTALGVEVFMWGIGCGHLEITEYKPSILEGVDLPFDIKAESLTLGIVSYS